MLAPLYVHLHCLISCGPLKGLSREIDLAFDDKYGKV
jgi:hypothetical protein